jgi:hypothetical protein
MTAPALLAMISAVICLQLAVGIGVGVWQRRQSSQRIPVAPWPSGLQPGSGGPSIMHLSLFLREVVPFFMKLALLGLAALGVDALLHWLDAVSIGRYLGIPGVLLILGSFGYSLRKHKLITAGTPVTLLRLHEYMAWAGSLLILVHAGIHFNAILGWLAVWAMLINIASGLTGKFLLQRARIRLEDTRTHMRAQGLSDKELEYNLYWDSLTFGAVKKWRVVHYPITLAFGILALGHITSIFWFWGWR